VEDSSKVLAGIFTTGEIAAAFAGAPRLRRKSQKDADPRNEMPSAEWRTAPKMLHPPVDGLHSIDFSADKTPPFLLTLKMKGVKTTSFFDSF
jgi:hypothetical protein